MSIFNVNIYVKNKTFIKYMYMYSHKCKGKRCEIFLNVQDTSCFSSSATNETYTIRLTISLNVTRNV